VSALRATSGRTTPASEKRTPVSVTSIGAATGTVSIASGGAILTTTAVT